MCCGRKPWSLQIHSIDNGSEHDNQVHCEFSLRSDMMMDDDEDDKDDVDDDDHYAFPPLRPLQILTGVDEEHGRQNLSRKPGG